VLQYAAVDTNLAKARDGDLNAYEQVVAEHQAEVWPVLTVLLYDRRRTERMVEAVFVEAYQRLGEYDPQYEFRAFIRTLARQRVRDELARHEPPFECLKTYYEHLGRVFQSDQTAVQATRQLHQAFRQCATKMTDAASQMLHHRYVLGHDPQQISRQVGKPERFVRQTLDRIRLKMAGCIASQLRRT